jgi:choline dehydrogenase
LLIDPAYLDREEDMERMMIGFRRAREIGNADELTPWRGEALEPAFDTSDDDACRAYIRASAGPSFHPVGTCRIGTDGMAVVDPCLRVRGVEGLRIADASVMPTIVSANTNATVLAIAERAATLISPAERG